MENIDNAMKINVYDYKAKTITNEIITCLKDPNGYILSLGIDMKRPEVIEHLAQHPEIQLTFPIENNKIVDKNSSLALFKYYNHLYVYNKKRFLIKPHFGALIYHGYMSEIDKELFSKILLGIVYREALILNADEISEGKGSVEDAIWSLADKYKKIRGAFEIK